MNREIKFAFWHKQKKEMWSAQSLESQDLEIIGNPRIIK